MSQDDIIRLLDRADAFKAARGRADAYSTGALAGKNLEVHVFCNIFDLHKNLYRCAGDMLMNQDLAELGIQMRVLTPSE